MGLIQASPFDTKHLPKKEYDRIIPGALVRVRGEEWRVLQKKRFLETDPKSHFEIYVEGLTGIVVGHKCVFLSNIDQIEIIEADKITLVQDPSKGFKKTKLYLESLLRRLPVRETNVISTGHKGVFDLKNYQFQPALKALNLPRPRILIGDGVGLGKTIEVGILLSELIKRGKGRRVLVVTPKAILTQFQKEIFTRFGIALTRLDSQGITELNRSLPSTMNVFAFHDRVIVSMDTLKNDRYLTALESVHWDTIIIDECHNVAIKGGNTSNQRARLARVLCEKAEAVILASATPHDGTMEGFASLIKLLDPTLIKDEMNFKFEDIQNVFIRRTKDTVKKEIKDGKLRRNNSVPVELSNKEEDLLEMLHDLTLDGDKVTLKGRKTSGGFKELFRTTLIKSYLSSPNALAETLSNKLKKIEKDSQDYQKLNKLSELTNKLTPKNFSKLVELKNQLDKIPKSKKVIIFTERIATLKLLEAELKAYGDILVMDGSMGDADLMSVASNFQSTTHKARILVASNVASEGLNLHHACHHLFHFDLPWSFITLEQRNGRIDRIGQKEVPELYYLTAKSDNPKLRADLHITEKLARRIEIAGDSMADESLSSGFLTGVQEEAKQTEIFEGHESSDIFDPMAELLMQVQESSIIQTLDTKKNLESFYESDFEFVSAALEELGYEYKPNNNEITIPLNKELRAELNESPREVTDHIAIKLQFDRKKMQNEIDKAIRENSWPAAQWGSDHHPLIENLKRQCIEIFPGDQTPVVFYKGKTDNHKMGFLMQGILYNKHGQVLLEEWAVCSFDTMFKKDALPYGPFKIHQIKEWTGLNGKNVVNPKEGLTSRLEKTIYERATPAAEWMTQVMKDLRTQRGKEKIKELKAETERINTWAQEREAALKVKIKNLKNENSGFAKRHIAEWEKEVESINKVKQEHLDWVANFYSTNATPIIRIVGIFVNAGKN